MRSVPLSDAVATCRLLLAYRNAKSIATMCDLLEPSGHAIVSPHLERRLACSDTAGAISACSQSSSNTIRRQLIGQHPRTRLSSGNDGLNDIGREKGKRQMPLDIAYPTPS
jgi:hypothetical protein